MRELFEKGVVEGKVEIKNKKFVMVFNLTGKCYEMKGKLKTQTVFVFQKILGRKIYRLRNGNF